MTFAIEDYIIAKFLITSFTKSANFISEAFFNQTERNQMLQSVSWHCLIFFSLKKILSFIVYNKVNSFVQLYKTYESVIMYLFTSHSDMMTRQPLRRKFHQEIKSDIINTLRV